MVEIHSIMDAGKNTAEFLVYGVGIGYLGKRYIGDMILKEGRKILIKTERDSAIVNHYMKQAKGQGHEAATPLDCGQEKCQVFGSVRQAA